MATAINTEAHDRAMQVVKANLTFASASQSATTTHSYYGFVTQVFIDHGGTAPSDNWDLVVTDEFGVDVLNGKGANIASGTDQHTFTQADLDNGMACSGQLTFSGTNGGTSSGVAEIYLYIARYQ
tara:strand:+ start:3752 stop:4126 length:375 start_codon:yes stop_codon:yes gene_type:complete